MKLKSSKGHLLSLTHVCPEEKDVIGVQRFRIEKDIANVNRIWVYPAIIVVEEPTAEF